MHEVHGRSGDLLHHRKDLATAARHGISALDALILAAQGTLSSPATSNAHRYPQPATQRTPGTTTAAEPIQLRGKKGRNLYGSKKMWRELNRDGIEVARCTVERLMREMGLEGLRARKKRPRTTVPGPAGQERPSDLLERDFTAPAPNRRWVADITYWVQPAVMCGPAGRSPCGLAGRRGSAVHNQRLWRKARSWPLGRYRAGAGAERGPVSRCSAASLAARSASR